MRTVTLPSLLMMVVMLLCSPPANLALALPSELALMPRGGAIPGSRGPTNAFNCGTLPPPPHILAVHQRWLDEEQSGAIQSRQNIAFPGAKPGPTTNTSSPPVEVSGPDVAVYIHVVSTAAQNPAVSPDMVDDQFQVMQDMFQSLGFNLHLENVIYTVNDTWAMDLDDVNMKKALRVGAYNDFNLYIQAGLQNGSLGYSTVVYDVKPGDDFSRDGSNVAAQTLPGGSISGFNMGRTAIHETLHWFGLLHTFQGNDCSGPGDYVSDTKAEAQSTSGCPTDKNTCPQLGPEMDPVHNYMDYSFDACYTEVTPGQQRRMHQSWTEYRQPNVSTAAAAA